MADPKLYANLPGIDFNSPDVYETSDLPEEDQANQEPAELSSASVEKIPLDTDAAFKIFKDKSLKTDFSDNVGKPKSGYFTDKSEYELAETGTAKETPQQKFQRLQHEMRELADEVNKIQAEVKDKGNASDKMSPVNLGKNLEYLQHQLADLHLDKLIGPDVSIDISDPEGALRQRLIKQLDSFGQSTTDSAKGKKGAAPSGAGDHVSYELYYRPEQTKFTNNTKLANLDERLERLENVIGKSQVKLNVLTADTHNKSLIGSVAILNSKLSLLEASNTETVEARLNAVLQKMQQVTDRKDKEPQTDPEKHKKISELFELVKKWEATADTLPQVVDRLISLKELHEQALQFSQAYTFLDTAQQEVKSVLLSHSDMVKQVKESMTENNKIIQGNIASIEKRLKALDKS